MLQFCLQWKWLRDKNEEKQAKEESELKYSSPVIHSSLLSGFIIQYLAFLRN